GVLAPGNSIESLTTAALSFANGSTYAFEIDSSVPLSVGADFTKALGNLWLSGTVGLSLANLAASPTGFAAGTTFSLVNYTGSWNGGLFSVGGSPVGDGSTFSFGTNTWRLDYAATTGGSNFTGDQTSGSFVNMVVVPEPAVLPLAALGMACAAAIRRRRCSG
ncbi:MAG: PEP-CTERM sorting domain-containing protein, partial [Planctomycetia bacterium]